MIFLAQLSYPWQWGAYGTVRIVVLTMTVMAEVWRLRDLFFFCLETKEAKIQGCKEKTSLRLEFRPESMPSAAG